MNDGQVLVLQIWTPHDNLCCDPGHASLKYGKLSVTLARLPLAIEVGVEAAVHVVETPREPFTENILTKHVLRFIGKLQIVFFCGSDIGDGFRFTFDRNRSLSK